jgi:hypothetical protein
MKRLFYTNLLCTFRCWLLGAITATLLVSLYCTIFALNNPAMQLTQQMPNLFLGFLPTPLAIGSALGVIVGQVQFWAWFQLFGKLNDPTRSGF